MFMDTKLKINPSCIFCGGKYKKDKMVSSNGFLDYLHIPPLGDKFQVVCFNCRDTVLKNYIEKYPHLFLQDDSHRL